MSTDHQRDPIEIRMEVAAWYDQTADLYRSRAWARRQQQTRRIEYQRFTLYGLAGTIIALAPLAWAAIR